MIKRIGMVITAKIADNGTLQVLLERDGEHRGCWIPTQLAGHEVVEMEVDPICHEMLLTVRSMKTGVNHYFKMDTELTWWTKALNSTEVEDRFTFLLLDLI